MAMPRVLQIGALAFVLALFFCASGYAPSAWAEAPDDLAEQVIALPHAQRAGAVQAAFEGMDDRASTRRRFTALAVLEAAPDAAPDVLRDYLRAVLEGSDGHARAALLAAEAGRPFDPAEVNEPRPGSPSPAERYRMRRLLVGPSLSDDEIVAEAAAEMGASDAFASVTSGNPISSDRARIRVHWAVWRGGKHRLTLDEFETQLSPYGPERRRRRTEEIHRAYDMAEAERVVDAFNRALRAELALTEEQVRSFPGETLPWLTWEGPRRVTVEKVLGIKRD